MGRKLKTGVPDKNGIVQPVCLYNQDNLTWSGKLIVNSLLVKLQNKLEKDMAYDISGPMAFTTIIEHQQQLNDSAVRVLVDKLKELKIKENQHKMWRPLHKKKQKLQRELREAEEHPII